MSKIKTILNGHLLVSETGDDSLTFFIDNLPAPLAEAINKQEAAEKAALLSIKTELKSVSGSLADLPVLTDTHMAA